MICQNHIVFIYNLTIGLIVNVSCNLLLIYLFKKHFWATFEAIILMLIKICFGRTSLQIEHANTLSFDIDQTMQFQGQFRLLKMF